MISLQEYKSFDATSLAQMVRNKDVLASELLECALEVLKTSDHNAVIHTMEKKARDQIDQQAQNSGRFQGVPFLLKDLLQAYQGEPMAYGSRALRDYRPIEDSPLVTKFKDSGLIIFGKTNTPEFGLMGVTEPEYFGVTKNPWNPDHTAGGSSGGSAAAVAFGITPMAGAGDGGGSIRIPASCCGLVGLKATRGRFPTGLDGEVWDGAVVEGVLSRSVRDSAYALEEFQGQSLNAFNHLAPIKIGDALERAHEKKFKILLIDSNPFAGAKIEDEVRDNLLATAKSLEQQGHSVEPGSLKIDAMAAARSYLTMYFGQVANDLNTVKTMVGGGREKEVELTTQMLAAIGKNISAFEYVQAKKHWAILSMQINQEFEKYDLIMTPTLATSPLPHHSFDPSQAELVVMQILLSLKATKILLKTGLIEQLASDSLSKLPFTFLTNLTGNPSINVPSGINSQGLPHGVHFIAPHGAEVELLQMAKILEPDKGFPTVF